MPRDVIGTAYVRIVAMSQDFEKQVQSSFDKLKPMAGKSGEDASKAWTDGFTTNLDTALDDGFSKARDDQRSKWAEAGTDHSGAYSDTFGSGMGNNLIDHQNATTDEMGKNWADAGQRHGGMYGDPFSTEVDRAMGRSVDNSTNLWRGSNLMRFPAEDIDKLFNTIMPNSATRGAHQSGQNIKQELGTSFSNIGKGISATLGDIFKGGSGGGRMWRSLTDGADEASKAFTMFFSIAELGGSLLVGLVAGLANVVSGLFALVSAAGQAGPALAVIPGLIAAIAQAGIGMMIGFKGLGKAITEGMKTSGASAGAAAARTKELETAQRAVANAARAVQSAEESAARAKANLTKAQQDLNDAYKEGAKQLRDIQYAAEDAALQEERSAINLADARDNLAKVKASNPADSRAVQEAELTYKEADLAYREARSRNKDASEEANNATKKGVKGTQAVVSAQDRLIAAQQAVRDSNQRVTDAVIALADAQKNLAETQKGSLGSMKAYNEALAKFGPEGQKFIKSLIGMQKQLRGFKQAAGEGMFKAMNKELGEFANGPFFPMLKRNFALTSTAMGGVITQFSNMIQESGNMASLDRIMKSNTVVIGSMGTAATNLGQAFLSITDAARPMTQEFAKWVAHLTAGWAATLKADNASGALTDKFDKASRVAKQLGRIFRNLWDAIYGTGRAASSGGALMLNDLEAASKKWADWVKSVDGNKQLKKYFEDVATGFKPLMEGLNSVVKELMKWGGNVKTVTAVGDSLGAVSKVIKFVGDAVEKIAPLFTDFAKAISDIFVVMQNSGALDLFMKTLTLVAQAIATVLTKIMEWKGIETPWGTVDGKKIIFFVGAIMGVVRALRLLNMGFQFLGKATIGKALLTLTHGFKGIKNVLGGNSFFDGMTHSSEEARKEFKKQMQVDALKKEHLEKVGKAGKHAADGIDKTTSSSKKSRGTKILDKLGLSKTPTGTHEKPENPVGKREKKSGLLGKVGKVGGIALGGVAAAVGVFAGLAALNKQSAADLGAQITAMMNNLPTAINAIAEQIPNILASVAQALPGVIASIGKALPGIVSGISSSLPAIITALADALPVVIKLLISLLPMVVTALIKVVPTLVIAIVKSIPIIIGALIDAIPAVVQAVADAVPGMGWLSNIADFLGPVVAALGAFAAVIGVVMGAIKLWQMATKAWIAVQLAFNAVMAMNPIVLIVAAIAAVIAVLVIAYMKFDGFRKIVDGLWQTIKNFVGKVIGYFQTLVDAFKSGGFSKLWETFKTSIVNAIPIVLGALSDLGKAIITWVMETAPKLWEKMKEWGTGFISWIVNTVPGLLLELGKLYVKVYTWIGTQAVKIAGKLIEWGWAFIKWIGPKIPGLLLELGKFIGKILLWVAQQIPNIIGKLAEWAVAFIGWIGPKIPGMLLELAKFIGKILVWIVQQIPSIVAKIAEWAGAFLGWIGGLLIKIPVELAKLWVKIASWIMEQAPKIVTKVGEWVGSFLGWIGDVVSKIPGKLAEIWTKISGWIGGLPKKIADAAVGMWNGLFDGLKTTFLGVVNWLIGKWNDVRFPSIDTPFGTTPDRLPHIDPIKFAEGGVVRAVAGGVNAILGEGGRSEVVKPLDGNGLTASDRLIMAMMKAQKTQMDKLVSGLTVNGILSSKTNPAETARAQADLAIEKARRAASTGGTAKTQDPGALVDAISHLNSSVDALQKPLVGGNINVVSAPNEWAAESVPRALRRRAYIRGGAR